MPAKKNILTDEQRTKNIRDAAKEIGASNDPAALERALNVLLPPKVVQPKPR